MTRLGIKPLSRIYGEYFQLLVLILNITHLINYLFILKFI